MPFTPAHVLAIVPLRSRRAGLLLSPLAVGSMAPDFEYFLRQSQVPGIGHTLPGVAIFCVPVGLGALWLFHRFLKHPLIALLPPRYHRAAVELAAPFRSGRRSGWPRPAPRSRSARSRISPGIRSRTRTAGPWRTSGR